MLLKREGYPEEGELVWCKVTNIHFHSVFCDIEEYQKQGMIHISEVSPGRIRNIHDYVKEGKPVVCKILSIKHDKGHIDLSLRRVSEGQRRKKANEIKQEKKAEKILESIAKQQKIPLEELYNKIKPNIFHNYEYLHSVFEEVVENNLSLESLGIEEKLSKLLTQIIKEKIKPKEVSISGLLKLKTYESEGINLIKKTIKTMSEKENTSIKYAGGGNFKILVNAKNFKIAENTIKQIVDIGEKNKKIIFSFERKK